MTIYDRIYLLCQAKSITGKQLGEMLSLKKSPMTDWKNGKAQPTVDQIIKMCDIFATSADYIILGNEARSTSKEEEQILKAYRQASPGIQEATKKLLDVKAGSRLGELSTSKIG